MISVSRLRREPKFAASKPFLSLTGSFLHSTDATLDNNMQEPETPLLPSRKSNSTLATEPATYSTCPLSLGTTLPRSAQTQPQRMTQARPQTHRRNDSQVQNVLMRQDIAAWASLHPTPPGSRAVSFSSWRRFSKMSATSKSSEDMRASILLEEHGTTPEFDPPLLERCELRIPEDEAVCGNPETDRVLKRCSSGLNIAYPRRNHPRIQQTHSTRTSSTTSWITATSEAGSPPDAPKPITFTKQMVRPASTSSLLTASIKESKPKREDTMPPKDAMEKIVKEMGLENLTIDDLAEDAFETDSEEGD